MRLSVATLDCLAPGVERFDYDRANQAAGIVHFGIGAFHRAHQAWYTDRAMSAGDRDWMIAGVSLRSPTVAEQLNPQDGLYSVTERSAAGARLRVIGAVQRVDQLATERTSQATCAANRAANVVTLTVTEKGYCRAPDGALDFSLAGANSIYRHLADVFRARRHAGLPGLTLLSCDNLAGNGAQLAQLLREYLARQAPDLGAWFDAECACPSSMVDRIVPATTAADLDAAAAQLALRDEAAVMTEPFSQWVIEDRFAGPRPRWEAVGAQLVADVAPYETAKLRMLNGAHSALAYLGLERGHSFVHEAIADPALRPLVEQLMREEAASSFTPSPEQDLGAYAEALLTRFANPALEHRLAQIAIDGSQKIPQRWLQTLAAQAAKGRSCPAILAALGAWLRFVRGDSHTVNDPLATELQRISAANDLAGTVAALFGHGGLLGDIWHPTPQDIALIATSMP